MKVGKLDLSRWTYGGQPLVTPLQLVRRVLCFVPLYACMALTFSVIVVGWGFEEAKEQWKRVR